MALYHFHVEQIKRSEGRTAVASAAYRAGEKLHNLWDGETHDYTKKGGVILAEIILPEHAPQRFSDRYTLWNEVEQVEKRFDAQLAYSFDMALQNEFSLEENMKLAREFVRKYFVSDGMICDLAVHQPDREEGGIQNPHFHVLVPIRPLNADGTWGAKQHRVYHLDEDGNRIKDENGKWVYDAVPTTNWGRPETLNLWREAWADADNPLTLADERIENAIRENNARLVIIDPLQAFLGANVDMNRANEVRPIFRRLAEVAQSTSCAIVMIGHLNKASGSQSTYRGLGSIDITAVVRSLLFIGKVRTDPTTRVIVHEKSSLAPPGQSLAFSLGDEKGFRWIGAYDISAEDLLTGGEGSKTELKQEQAVKLIEEFLSEGRKVSIAEINKEATERGISERTVRLARNSMGDKIASERQGKDWWIWFK